MALATIASRLGCLAQRQEKFQQATSRCRAFASFQNNIHREDGSLCRFPGRRKLQGAFLFQTLNCNNRMGVRRQVHHRLPGASTRDMAELEDRIFSAVTSSVKDPELDVDLKTLGWMNRRLALSDDGSVQLLLRLPTMLHPTLDDLKALVKVAAQEEMEKWAADKGLEMEAKVNVEAIATKPIPWMAKDTEDLKDIELRLGPGLANVAHFVAVYSCKGGVGKSTIAVNLAYELARMGGRVGLLDADVYGPSLPILVKPDDPAVRQSPLGKGMVYPIEHKGVKLLSLGFVASQSGVPGSGQGGGAAVLRGPMAAKVVTQLLKGTDWGDLDVLVLDLPPGTGDVQLTICQDLELSGAVGVTTPSKLAIADSRKGIEMFSTLGVPTLALVENMAYFECEGGGKHFPFGKGFEDFLKEEGTLADMNAGNVCQLPISSHANDANDTGVPLSIARPDAAVSELRAFSQLAKIVSTELFQLPHRVDGGDGQVTFEDSSESFDLISIQLSVDGDSLSVRAFSENGALQKQIPAEELRRRDPKTGQPLDTSDDADESSGDGGMVTVYRSKAGMTQAKAKVVPDRVEKKAKVGFEVTWSDGAKYIYSRRAIALAAGGLMVN